MTKLNQPLEDKDLKECINEVNDKYLNKPFPGDPQGDHNKLETKKGETIYRPNSNVVHVARLPLYVPMVIEELKYNTTNSSVQKEYNNLNVAQIQFTVLYLSACKANENGWEDKENLKGVDKSIEAFKQAAKSKDFFKDNNGQTDEAAIKKYAEAMKDYGDPEKIEGNSELDKIKRVMHITTQMDLSRCYGAKEMQTPLKNCRQYLGEKSAGKLFLCAAKCIEKTTGVFDQKTLNTYAKMAGREKPKNKTNGRINKDTLLEHTQDPAKIITAWQEVTTDLKAHEKEQYHKKYVANDQFDQDGAYKQDNLGGFKYNVSSRTGLGKNSQTEKKYHLGGVKNPNYKDPIDEVTNKESFPPQDAGPQIKSFKQQYVNVEEQITIALNNFPNQSSGQEAHTDANASPSFSDEGNLHELFPNTKHKHDRPYDGLWAEPSEEQKKTRSIEKGREILAELEAVKTEFETRHNIKDKQATGKKVQEKATAIDTAIRLVDEALKESKSNEIIPKHTDKNIETAVKVLRESLQKHRLLSFGRQTKSFQSLEKQTNINKILQRF